MLQNILDRQTCQQDDPDDNNVIADTVISFAMVLQMWAAIEGIPKRKMTTLLEMLHSLKPKGVDLQGLCRTGEGLLQVNTYISQS